MRPPRPARPPRPPGRSGRRRSWIVPRLPGLAHHYLEATLGGFPDEVGGVNGVHTGSPSLATEGDVTGVEYDGATQYTTIGNTSTFAFIHQTWKFAISAWFRWAGPAGGGALEVIFANALGAATRGVSLFVDDDFSSLGERMLTAQLARGQAGLITRLNSDPLAIVVNQLHHALLTCDGDGVAVGSGGSGGSGTARLYLDGVLVASDSVLPTAAGNSSYAMRLGDTAAASPTFAFNGEVYDAPFGTEDWGAYAAQIYADGPGGFG